MPRQYNFLDKIFQSTSGTHRAAPCPFCGTEFDVRGLTLTESMSRRRDKTNYTCYSCGMIISHTAVDLAAFLEFWNARNIPVITHELTDFLTEIAQSVGCLPSYADASPFGGNDHIRLKIACLMSIILRSPVLTKMLDERNTDEPIFVLRAKDEAAIRVLNDWFERNAANLKGNSGKIKQFNDIVAAFHKWRGENTEKIKRAD